MTSLAELQKQLQADILSKSNGSLAIIKAPVKGDKAARLSVYQTAYILRLTEILGNENEALLAYMGDNAFQEMAALYFEAFPSRHPNARFVSNHLSEFLENDPKYAQHPVLADMARLEWAIEFAFDCPDHDVMTMDNLAALPQEQIGDLRLEFAPPVQLLSLATNAMEILQALKAEETPPSVNAGNEEQKVLIWRQDLVSKYRKPDPEEVMLLEQARKQKTFGALCEMAFIMDDPENSAARVAGYLTHWINCGMISGFELDNE